MRTGISQTLWIIVTAIVVIVTALVVLTIFSSGIGNVSQFTAAKATCRTQMAVSCTATGQEPATWRAPTVKDDNGNPTSCANIPWAGGCECKPEGAVPAGSQGPQPPGLGKHVISGCE